MPQLLSEHVLDDIFQLLEAALAAQNAHIGVVAAAHWAMTHDVSAAFRTLLKQLLEALGHERAAERI